MGTVEEGEKVAGSVVEAMKSQPLALALVIVNLCFLVAGVYFLHDLSGVSGAANSRRDALITEMMNNQREAMNLLSRCVVPADAQHKN